MLVINLVVPLDELMFVPYINSTDETEQQQGFEVRTKDRPFHLIADSESDKRIWCEEIELAIRAYLQTPGLSLASGWHHRAIGGSLFSAVCSGDISDVKKQISELGPKRKDIDDVDDYCMTALHWAALTGNCVNVASLLDAGANIDALNNGLNSPLLMAAAAGHADVFIFLVERGADVFLRNLKDRDALYLIFIYAHSNSSVQVMLDILLTKGVELDLCDSSGASPLHVCASLGLPHAIDLLIACGANVNQPHERSGLTPLQMCCSRPDVDPETVRTLLERGAFPNALTPGKANAIDLMLQSFASKHGVDMRMQSIGGGHGPISMDMDMTADFAMETLPVLMEIAKRGGRYSDETMSVLRASFVEAVATARKQWLEQVAPDDFLQFVEVQNLAQGHQKWADDKESSHCILCIAPFTMYNRRHHCRHCGILCCDACSTKRLTQPGSSDAALVRVCDSCFNQLIHSYACRKKDFNILEKKRRDDSRAAAEASKNASSGQSKSIFSWGSSGDTGSSKGGSPRDVASETMDALVQRGEKLHEVNDKAREMNEAASEFNRATKQLLKQQKERSMW